MSNEIGTQHSLLVRGREGNTMVGRRVHSDVDDLRIHGTWGPSTVERRLIAVVPAYNEAPTVEGVLTRLYPMVDGLIIVDDGSRDETRAIVTRWIADKPHASLIAFDANRGLSAGYGAAFRFVRREVAAGRLDASDLILTVDADGQHDPDDVNALVAALEQGGLDGLMARRDFSLYPGYKKVGNWLMSAWATLWSGQRFYDVESGYRVFRAGPLGEATQYYEGYRYSETVELAMILPRLGYKLGNNHLVPVPVYRSNTRMKDVFIDLARDAARLVARDDAARPPRGNQGALGTVAPRLFLRACCSLPPARGGQAHFFRR